MSAPAPMQPVISMVCNISKVQLADGTMAVVLVAQMPGGILSTQLAMRPSEARTIADGLLKMAQVCESGIIQAGGIVAPGRGN